MSVKIVIDDKIPFIRGVFENVAEVVYLPGSSINADVLKDADALITRTRTQCNRELLEGSSVKIIASATIGFDHIDTEFCESRGVKWTNAPGCNSGSVLQYVLSALFSWEKKYSFPLSGKTLGIVGVGNVGSKIAVAAKALGMKVILNDPPRKDRGDSEEFRSLNELIVNSDFITFHTPLNRSGCYKSYHLADFDFFEKIRLMGKECFLINSSRGGVVDNSALKQALISNKELHACLDVWENEPDIDLELMDLCDFATSHIAGYSADGKANGTMMAVRSVSRCLGLGLDEWTPEKTDAGQISLDSSLAPLQIIRNIHATAYSIEKDSELLKKKPADFEKHRGDYRIRRELSQFSIESDDLELSSKVEAVIKKISF